jgi:acyl-CoA synthetase (AMP-forming)/AMP-acid ligase II
MIKLDRPRFNNLQDEIVAAVLDVMFVTDELCRRADKCANHDRTEWQQGKIGVRATTAVVYNIHRQYFSCKFLPKRGKAIALRKHLYVPLDPSYPAERLAFMLEDSAPVVLITDEAPGRLF